MPELSLKIKTIPFVRILPAIVLGILISGLAGEEQWIWWGALGVTYVCSLLTIEQGAAGWFYTFASLTFAAAAITGLHEARPAMPRDEKLLLQLEITDNSSPRGRWMASTARVGYFRPYYGEGEWKAVDQKILFDADTCYSLPVGSRLVCAGYVNPIAGRDSVENGYSRLMHVRGYSGRSYLTPGNLKVLSPESSGGLRTWARRVQKAAAERLSRLDVAPDELAVATAMTVGERRSMTAELKNSYSRVGASHLLSVSGLHVGIVFLLINCILYLLPLARRGNVIKNILAVAAIWAYAAMAGLSPSVMRSAMMFTGAQAALAATLHRDMINIMLGTAAVMLMIWPGNLYDVSFLLSMIAVLGIMLLYKPLFGLVKTKYRFVNAVAGAFMVGVAATVGTAPLVAYYFHNFPVFGILINPFVVLTAYVVVLLSLLWIIAPIGFLSVAAGWLIQAAAWLQNTVIGITAGLPGSAFEVNLGFAGVIGIYVAYFVIFVAFNLRRDKTEPVTV